MRVCRCRSREQRSISLEVECHRLNGGSLLIRPGPPFAIARSTGSLSGILSSYSSLPASWAVVHVTHEALYSRTFWSYSRSIERSRSSRRQILSRMRRANPNRTSSRMPMFLIFRMRLSLARVRFGSSPCSPGCSYSMGTYMSDSRSSPSSQRRSLSLPIRRCLPAMMCDRPSRPRVSALQRPPSGPRLFASACCT